MEKRIHKVGSITAGIGLIVFGLLALAAIFTNVITYRMILNIWPLLLIGMGIEILCSTKSKSELVYDKGAVWILVLLMIFAMMMAEGSLVLTKYIH